MHDASCSKIQRKQPKANLPPPKIKQECNKFLNPFTIKTEKDAMHVNLEGNFFFSCSWARSECITTTRCTVGSNLGLDLSYVAQQPAKEEVPQDDVHVTSCVYTHFQLKKTPNFLLLFSVLLSVKWCQTEVETADVSTEEGIKSAGCLKVLDAFKKNSFVTFQRGNDTIIAVKTMIRWTRLT